MADAEVEHIFETLNRRLGRRGLSRTKITIVLAQYLGKVIAGVTPEEAQVPHIDAAWRAMWSTWAGTITQRYGPEHVPVLVELFRAVESRDPGAFTKVTPGQPAGDWKAGPVAGKGE